MDTTFLKKRFQNCSIICCHMWAPRPSWHLLIIVLTSHIVLIIPALRHLHLLVLHCLALARYAHCFIPCPPNSDCSCNASLKPMCQLFRPPQPRLDWFPAKHRLVTIDVFAAERAQQLLLLYITYQRFEKNPSSFFHLNSFVGQNVSRTGEVVLRNAPLAGIQPPETARQ